MFIGSCKYCVYFCPLLVHSNCLGMTYRYFAIGGFGHTLPRMLRAVWTTPVGAQPVLGSTLIRRSLATLNKNYAPTASISAKNDFLTSRVTPAFSRATAQPLFTRMYGLTSISRAYSTAKKPTSRSGSNAGVRPPQPINMPSNSAQQIGLGPVPKASGLAKPRVVSSKSVAYWLLICGAAVFGIVVLGGLTRLTESGLSITEWRPLTGAIPPITDDEWEEQFNLYKESPEFKELNTHMTLEEYKFIYYMEWGHRLWGRAIGALVLIPGAYFVLKGRTSPRTNRALVGISLLLGLQGAIGWWMVYSGLDRDHLDTRADSQPRVGHYRLATHLGAAFLLYFAMATAGLRILKQQRYISKPIEAAKEIAVLASPLATGPRRFARGLLGLAALTVISGSFVAGLDAGLLYNTFPLMGGKLTPSTNELFDERYARDSKDGDEKPSSWKLFYRNVLDNPVTVHLTHRILAVSTWTACAAFFIYARKRRALLPPSIYKGAHGVIGFATLQAALGITTLVYVVPVPAAALHQAGALAFITAILILLNRLHVPSPQIRKLIKLMAESTNAAQKAAKQSK